MSEQITAKLWRKKDWNDGTDESQWKPVGVRLTGTRSDLNEVALMYRIGHYQEFGKWYNYEFRELPKPIRSGENPILDTFRASMDGIIGANLPKEATWWLQLLEWDPEMTSDNYWDVHLRVAVKRDREVIESAIKVLKRIAAMGGVA